MLRIMCEDILTEASYITFGGQANPPYGWSVCIAGGPGSGKGFVKEKIFLLDFTSFDVDDLKKKFTQAVKNPESSFRKYTDKDTYDMSNPDDVTDLHNIVKQGGWEDKVKKNVLSNNNQEHLPNVVFDVTGDNINKLIKNVTITKELGYKTALVWVVTNREEAMVRNVLRDRTVSDTVLHTKHNTINTELYKFITTTAGKYFDECWVVFNSNAHVGGTTEEAKWLEKHRVIQLKKNGNSFKPTTREFARIFMTLGEQEPNPEHPEKYVDVKTTKDIVSKHGNVTSKTSPTTDWGKTSFKK